MAGCVRVFLNPKSGRGGCEAEAVEALFAKLGCACSISELAPGLNIQALHADEPMHVAFIAAGGDGTVHSVAQVVAGSERAMGVLPVGTLNHFAKDIGMPQELEAAIEVIAAGHTRQVDAAEVNGQVFVNNSSLGVYPSIVVDRERMKLRGWNKWVSLVMASARQFIRMRKLRVSVVVDGECRRLKTPFLFVGNNDYTMEGFEAGSRAAVDRGTLSLYMAPGISRLGLLRFGVAAILGRLERMDEFTHLTVTDFKVETGRRRRKLRAALDGELKLMSPPLLYRSLPGSLRVLVPAPKDETSVLPTGQSTPEAH